MKTKALVLALLATSAFQFGCDEKTAEEVLPSISVIIGDVVGTWDSQCVAEPIGSGSGAAAYRDLLIVASNGNVQVSRAWSDAGNCLGNTVMQHDIDATLSITGTNVLNFTVTGNEFRTYADSGFNSWLNSASGCNQKTGGFGSGSTVSVSGVACGLGAQASVGGIIYNKAEVTSTTLKIGKSATSAPLGYSSSSSIPSSLELVFVKR